MSKKLISMLTVMAMLMTMLSGAALAVAGEENLIKKLATVTNITYTTAGMQARYVADEPVVDGSEKIVGTLEDAYIAAVGGVSR